MEGGICTLGVRLHVELGQVIALPQFVTTVQSRWGVPLNIQS
jgi:hypothetical protein